MIVLGMTRHAALDEVRQEVDGVRGARVLGERLRVEVEPARLRVDHDVLEHGAETVRRFPDLRLRFFRQLDGFRVAAAFEVEHAVVRPAVLVVADERAVRVGGKRRLAGARQAEEDRDGAVLPDVGGAVHREHVAQRHQVVHHGEHGLLDLARVARAADQDDLAREVHHDERRGVRVVARGIGVEQRRVDHRELRRERFVLIRRVDEEVAREQVVPRVLGHDAHRQAVARIGADVAVQREHVLAVQIRRGAREQRVERRRVDGLVHAPVDVRLAAGLAHEELVVGGAPGVLAGFHDELPVRPQKAFAPGQGVLVELSGALVAVHRPDAAQAEAGQMFVEGLRRVRYRENRRAPRPGEEVRNSLGSDGLPRMNELFTVLPPADAFAVLGRACSPSTARKS